MGLSEYVENLKSAALDIGVTSVMGVLEVQAPIIKAPIVHSIVKFFVTKIIKLLLWQTEVGAFFVYTDVRVNQQGIDFEQAAERNRQIQETGTEEEKLESQKILREKFKVFVSLTS